MDNYLALSFGNTTDEWGFLLPSFFIHAAEKWIETEGLINHFKQCISDILRGKTFSRVVQSLA